MEKEKEKEEDFEEVFDEAAAEGDGKKKETETPEEEVAKPTEGEEESQEKKEPTFDELEQKYKSLQGMFEVETKRNKDLEEKINKLSEQFEKVEEEPEKIKEPKPEEQDVELDEYIKEYGYIQRNEAKLRSKEYGALKQEVFKDISDKYDITIKSAERLVEDRLVEDETKHIETIQTAHADYGVAYKKSDIMEWTETLSPTRKRTYKEIIGSGNTEEVIELISDFKEAKNIKVEEKIPGKEEEIHGDDKDKKLKEMEVVIGKKSPVGGSLKKNEDFESAFDEAASVK